MYYKTVKMQQPGGVYVVMSKLGSIDPTDMTFEGLLSFCCSGGPYLRKYDPNGQELWTRQVDTIAYDESNYANEIKVHTDGSMYIRGVTYRKPDDYTIFDTSYLKKYDPYGKEMPFQQLSGLDTNKAASIALDAKGNIYVARKTNFEKYDARGKRLWTRQYGADFNGSQGPLTVDAQGSVYVAGSNEDALIRKYDSSGKELWTAHSSTKVRNKAMFVGVYEIAVDQKRNVYAVGTVEQALSKQRHLGKIDAYIKKYNSDGQELWTKQFGTTQDDYAMSVAVDKNGNAYVVGKTYGNLPGQKHLGYFDAYIQKYDPSGKELWVRQFGTAAWDNAYSIALDTENNIYISGSTSRALPGQKHFGSHDAYLRKYDTNGQELWTRQFGSSVWDGAYAVAIAP
ncbi:MAG: SBBP repeat-containing protein [Deinococcaceae bacterium]